MGKRREIGKIKNQVKSINERLDKEEERKKDSVIYSIAFSSFVLSLTLFYTNYIISKSVKEIETEMAKTTIMTQVPIIGSMQSYVYWAALVTILFSLGIFMFMVIKKHLLHKLSLQIIKVFRKTKNTRKGSVWISAVLYIALGVIVITLVLSAGIPLINKMKDQNVFSQTKKVMFVIDENIRDVVNEGPGSKRYLSPIEINRGELIIDDETENITWRMVTTNKLFEVNELGISEDDRIVFIEGNLVMWLDETQNEDEYELSLELGYSPITDLLLSSGGSPFKGQYNLMIYHTGDYSGDTPIISLEFI